jgi:hypothetical protein
VGDTTGFSTNVNSAVGGWHGIQFTRYDGTAPDASTLQYCDISYTKFDSVDQYANPWLNTLYCRRNLSVKYCNFYNNCVPKFVSYGLFFIDHFTSSYVFEMTGCKVYNNRAPHCMIWIMGSTAYLKDNKFYDNTSGLGIIRTDAVKLLFENNEAYGNTSHKMDSGGSFLSVIGDRASTVKGNKIYKNNCTRNAVISCGGGKVDIIGNLLANNYHIDGHCGLVDGGGGVQLSTNWSGINPDSTLYNLRNNIFANNYSPLYGAGINIMSAQTHVVNNHFVNNVSATGSCIFINNPWTPYPVEIRNNLFFGNADLDSVLSTANVTVYNGGPISYEYNWTQRPYHLDLKRALLSSAYTLVGDTTTNVIGTDPGMISPTTAADLSIDATLANFRLRSTSPCINRGNTTGIIVDPVDYAGNPRVNGPAIDLGAFEYLEGSEPPAAIGTATRAQIISVHPNPATNLVVISTPQAAGTLQICDLSGKAVAELDVTYALTPFETYALPRGVYFAIWNNGSNRNVEKFILE